MLDFRSHTLTLHRSDCFVEVCNDCIPEDHSVRAISKVAHNLREACVETPTTTRSVSNKFSVARLISGAGCHIKICV